MHRQARADYEPSRFEGQEVSSGAAVVPERGSLPRLDPRSRAKAEVRWVILAATVPPGSIAEHTLLPVEPSI
jgi:hypothetical protein